MIFNLIKKARENYYKRREFKCPEALARNHINLTPLYQAHIKKSLIKNYFSYRRYFPVPPRKHLKTEQGKNDLLAHIDERIYNNRNLLVPWIDDSMSIKGKDILEIGCGTGSGTLAFAEQGASLYSCDVHDGSLKCAKDRLAYFNLDKNVEFFQANAIDIDKACKGKKFDIILMLAVMEHLTHEERMSVLQKIKTLKKNDTIFVINESPNRLWYDDTHTSREHFYLWLPDDLAKKFAYLTRREPFNKLITAKSSDVDLSRWGRGVSYHDFCVAWDKKPQELEVLSCLSLFLREKNGTQNANRFKVWRRYEDLIRSLEPKIHRGFFLPYIDLIFRL